MFPVPVDRPPIWIAGKSRAALQRAVRHDGWLGMNYDLHEVVTLVDRLQGIRDDRGDRRTDFEVFVAANAVPDRSLYEELEGHGVTSTLAVPWNPGDPAYAAMAAKREALEQFAAEIMEPLAGT
jgi:alkanesulfonate monooxygenase SsuD/methylene tetrahydromethanopterin reductase-like flavin-dependent oxidoreductase (luciferase family)